MADHVSSLFLRARELPLDERARFLDLECEARPELRRQVESLLAHDRADPDWMPEQDPRGMLGEVARATLERSELSLVGLQLGHYPILGVLGRGGMGVVYLSQQASPRRPVA